MATAEMPSSDEPSVSPEPAFTSLSELSGQVRYTGVPIPWESDAQKARIAELLGLRTTPPKTLVAHVAEAKEDYVNGIVDPDELKGFHEGYALGLRHEKEQLKRHASFAGRFSRVHAQVINVIKEAYGKQEDTNPRH